MLPQKSTLNLFRDCLKLIPTMVKDEPKILAVKQIVISEFRKNKDIRDTEQIDKLRDNAIRGISNYMIFMIKQEYLDNPNRKEFYDQQAIQEQEVEDMQQTFK